MSTADDTLCTDEQRSGGTKLSENTAIPQSGLDTYETVYAGFGFTYCDTDDCNKADACTGGDGEGDIQTSDSCSPNSPCSEEGSVCTEGTETCCGQTFPSLQCDCADSGGGKLEYMCMYTDACMVPNCKTDSPVTSPATPVIDNIPASGSEDASGSPCCYASDSCPADFENVIMSSTKGDSTFLGCCKDQQLTVFGSDTPYCEGTTAPSDTGVVTGTGSVTSTSTTETSVTTEHTESDSESSETTTSIEKDDGTDVGGYGGGENAASAISSAFTMAGAIAISFFV